MSQIQQFNHHPLVIHQLLQATALQDLIHLPRATHQPLQVTVLQDLILQQLPPAIALMMDPLHHHKLPQDLDHLLLQTVHLVFMDHHKDPGTLAIFGAIPLIVVFYGYTALWLFICQGLQQCSLKF